MRIYNTTYKLLRLIRIPAQLPTIDCLSIPPLSAGNFVIRLFCQEYPVALRGLNTVEECFIARAHVIGAFLKLTSGAQKGISYRGARGHYVAVKQDPSNILSILPTKRLQDHTTITVSWEKETPPSEENLARFCSDGLFENELDAEVEDLQPGTIVSRSFFSDFHGQDPQATTALLASLQAVLESKDSDGVHGMSKLPSAYN
ncbi:hypothetical protein ACEPPN_019343 [Leptodophora sp. 'Broadleaf-Isolate-01']